MLLARKSNCDCAAIRRKRQKTSTNGYTTRRCHSDEKQKFVVPREASEPAKRVTTARKSEKRGQSWVKTIRISNKWHLFSIKTIGIFNKTILFPILKIVLKTRKITDLS